MIRGGERTQNARKVSKGSFPEGRTYHLLSNTGADRRALFSSQEDFDRFEAYLYLLNAVEGQRAANFFVGGREHEIFTSARGDNLIAIGAYSFTPRSFHILVTPLVEGGVGKFMQKLQTAYTMYFNAKYAHTGRLFHSAYQSERIESDDALKRAFGYVHLVPAALFNEEWETERRADELAQSVMRALEYRYSSVHEYRGSKFVVASPTMFPAAFRRLKDAHAHFALWVKYRDKK